MVRPASCAGVLVGAAGFEPTTLSSRTIRATKLRHAPTGCPLSQGPRSVAEARAQTHEGIGSGAHSVAGLGVPVQVSSRPRCPAQSASTAIPGLPLLGSRIRTTARAASTNEIAISQKTIGSPADSPSQAMIAP